MQLLFFYFIPKITIKPIEEKGIQFKKCDRLENDDLNVKGADDKEKYGELTFRNRTVATAPPGGQTLLKQPLPRDRYIQSFTIFTFKK